MGGFLPWGWSKPGQNAWAKCQTCGGKPSKCGRCDGTKSVEQTDSQKLQEVEKYLREHKQRMVQCCLPQAQSYDDSERGTDGVTELEKFIFDFGKGRLSRACGCRTSFMNIGKLWTRRLPLVSKLQTQARESRLFSWQKSRERKERMTVARDGVWAALLTPAQAEK